MFYRESEVALETVISATAHARTLREKNRVT
jgi:hypothetical protein